MKPVAHASNEAYLAQRLDVLKRGCHSLGIVLSQEEQNRFYLYLKLLLEWGKTMNLYSTKDRSRLVERHLLESMASLVLIKERLIPPVMDLGSGAGFPGIPWAILYPQLNLVLIESKRKKALFLEEVVSKLHLPVQVLAERAETLAGDPEYQRRFGCVVARAVSPLVKLVPLTEPFLTENGLLVTFKGDRLKEELDELQQIRKKGLDFKVEILDYVTFESRETRNLVMIQFSREK